MKHHWFYLKWYLRKTSSSPLQGFTMLEVLAALMISFAFLMGTLNALA
ncbi:MAG: prepilin-type N-terminal cleavage/methylation domain-containing protein, partial [Microcystaceae cyanobacterium]